MENEIDKILDQYLEGRITKEQVRLLHEHIRQGGVLVESDNADTTEVKMPEELYYVSPEIVFDETQRFEELKKRRKEYHQKSIFRHAALSVVLFVIIVFTPVVYLFMSISSSTDALINRYFRPYDVSKTERKLNNMTLQDKWDSSANKYARKNYTDAIISFNNLISYNPEDVYIDHFYIGLSYIGKGQPREAIDHLEKAIAVNHELTEPARWYLALAHLQNEEIDKTKSLLKPFISEEVKYNHEEAEKLMKSLDR